MAGRLLTDPEQDGWERSDFPIVCETCLGPNPYVRMQRMEYGGTCHISGRPYTVFRWRPGNDARYKKTIICQEVAKAKNVCQVCLLDLDYNLPVQVRDHALGMQDEGLPESVPGKEYALNQMAETGELNDRSKFNAPVPNDLLLKLQRNEPHYKRNQARICSFFARGECKRGAECPYRHEMPAASGPMSEQNIKDRYYGVNDPVANTMLSQASKIQGLKPPEDRSITTLFVGGVSPAIGEDDLRDVFYAHGELKSVKKIEAKNCAFVTYTTREGAERAMQQLASRLLVKGEKCKLLWGKPQRQKEGGGQQKQQEEGKTQQDFFGLPKPGQASALYPSMDPQQAGTRAEGAEEQPQQKRQKRQQPDDTPPDE